MDLRVALQQPLAEPVDGRDEDTLDVAAEEACQPQAQLFGRLASEGGEEQGFRLDPALAHQIGSAPQHHLGLAGAGAGDDQ